MLNCLLAAVIHIHEIIKNLFYPLNFISTRSYSRVAANGENGGPYLMGLKQKRLKLSIVSSFLYYM